MSEFNVQSKPSLDKAKAVLREQWPEVIQYIGDRFTPSARNYQSKSAAERASSAASQGTCCKRSSEAVGPIFH
ncbi:hypothetical protein [Altericista sp. CCNU0014]|uniref:hypothetical protein n=1 Tax=Altericista sp. CCNU0014 TaxID=3082949 RepID=UPI00384A9259